MNKIIHNISNSKEPTGSKERKDIYTKKNTTKKQKDIDQKRTQSNQNAPAKNQSKPGGHITGQAKKSGSLQKTPYISKKIGSKSTKASVYTKHYTLLRGRYTYWQFVMGIDLMLSDTRVFDAFSTVYEDKFIDNPICQKTMPLLQAFCEKSEQKNIFGYLGQLSAKKGFLMSYKELLDDNEEFRVYLESTLGNKYIHFEQLIRFLRNVYVHATDVQIRLHGEGFHRQRDYLLYKKIDALFFEFIIDNKKTSIHVPLSRLLTNTVLDKMITEQETNNFLTYAYKIFISFYQK